MIELSEASPLRGVVLRFADLEGDAPAIVLLHGAGADHATFDAQAEAVSRDLGRRVILLDLRGHGRSRPNQERLTAELLLDDVSSLIARLRLDRPALVGHSLGGNLAQALVRRDPRRFSALAVIGSTWSTGPLSRADRLLLRAAAPALALVPATRLPRLMADASATTPGARADALRAFSTLSKRELLDVWRATVRLVEPDPDYRSPIPLLLMRGEQDATGNIAAAMTAWAAAEGVREHVIPGAGHLVTQDAPAAASAVLLPFLREHR